MASILTPLFLNELLGAPMTAVVEAEAQAARATADFIKEVGFTGTGDITNPALGDVRMVNFNYSRRNADGSLQKVSMEVPLLSLVPIPAVQVAEATIDLDVLLTSVSNKTETTTPAGNAAPSLKILKRQEFALKGILSKKEQPGTAPTTTTRLNMQVQIKLRQADLTHGMVQLLNLMDKGIDEKTP